jgi:hypothetical protein
LFEYVFVDRPRLKSYVEQIKGPNRIEKIPSWDVSISGTGPHVTGKQTATVREHTDHEMIELLLHHLRRNDLVSFQRPADHHDVQHAFVLERTVARKAIFPLEDKPSSIPLKEIAVWVSDPAQEQLDSSGYAEGTFLYLLEAYWESDQPCMTTHSSFSALNAIVTELANHSVIANVPPPLLSGGKSRPVGLPHEVARLRSSHPAEAFEILGARLQLPRRIETLYRKRYLTDEKVFEDSSGIHRCNDLFAYPIFIRDSEHV